MSQGVTFNQDDDAYLKTFQAAAVNLTISSALNAKLLVPVHLYNPQDDLTGKLGSLLISRGNLADPREQHHHPSSSNPAPG